MTLPPKVKNEMGKHYGWLSVLGYAGMKGREAMWVCVCKCGTRKVVSGHRMRVGRVKSCGCKLEAYRRSSERAIRNPNAPIRTPLHHYGNLVDRLPPSTFPDPWLDRFQRERNPRCTHDAPTMNPRCTHRST